MNEGEISEYILKAFLLREKDEGREDTIFGKITELSDDGELENATWQKKPESSLKKFDYHKIEKILGIGKSKTGTKADVSVNNVRYSVKEMNSAPPAIVNHTPRNGFENVCERIGAQIDTLDSIIDELSEKHNPDDDTEIESFEPREDHKGDAARAMFYYYAMYSEIADHDFCEIQKERLLNWKY